jgi:hypothetical protein
VGYDVELVQVSPPAGLSFPVEPDAAKRLLAQVVRFADDQAVRAALLAVAGCKPGPGDSVDYVGERLSYARFSVLADRVHVENNCSARELLKVHEELSKTLPNLCILDLQSGRLHDAASFAAWWARPL